MSLIVELVYLERLNRILSSDPRDSSLKWDIINNTYLVIILWISIISLLPHLHFIFTKYLFESQNNHLYILSSVVSDDF